MHDPHSALPRHPVPDHFAASPRAAVSELASGASAVTWLSAHRDVIWCVRIVRSSCPCFLGPKSCIAPHRHERVTTGPAWKSLPPNGIRSTAHLARYGFVWHSVLFGLTEPPWRVTPTSCPTGLARGGHRPESQRPMTRSHPRGQVRFSPRVPAPSAACAAPSGDASYSPPARTGRYPVAFGRAFDRSITPGPGSACGPEGAEKSWNLCVSNPSETRSGRAS